MISTLSGNSAASSQESNFERRGIAVNAVQSRSYHKAHVNERWPAGPFNFYYFPLEPNCVTGEIHDA